MIANALAERGHEVTMLSFWDHGKPFFPVNEHVTVDYLMRSGLDGKLYRTYIYPILKLRSYVKKHRFDVLIDIDSVLAYWSVPALRGLPCKHIVWDHFNYRHIQTEPRRVKAYELTRDHADKLVLLTQQDCDMYVQAGFPPSKLHVINNPTPFEGVRRSPREGHIVLSVGRLTDQKGYDRLIAVWSRISDQVGDWKLVIVGSGELESSLKRQVMDANIDNILFVPATKDVEHWYDRASIYAMTSRFEGFPMVLLEAMAKGLPIIAYDCLTGPREMVHDGETGYLVPDGDANQFAQKLLKMLSNRSLQDQYSQAALHAVNRFYLRSIADQWESLIKDILE
ncbi:EpsS [Bifidobacterium callimiconis]|uniref:EpsS n=2 Tax=Bifidobacterium callimiconis TaxID=2306973 RepID=A0A430FBN9_9BIFI|nr:EpsS [Bifidobacterium callimiconis]